MDWLSSFFKYPEKICPKCPEVKCPKTKCPEVKCPVTKCPEVKCPVTKCPVDENVYKFKKILDDVLESKLDNLLRHVFRIMKKIKDDNSNNMLDKKLVKFQFNKSYDEWKNSPGLKTFLDKVCKSDPNDLKIEFEKRLNYKRSFKDLVPVNSEPISLSTYRLFRNRKPVKQFKMETVKIDFLSTDFNNRKSVWVHKRVVWGKGKFKSVPNVSLMLHKLDCLSTHVNFLPRVGLITSTGCTVSVKVPMSLKMWGVSYTVVAHNQFSHGKTLCQSGRVNMNTPKTQKVTIKFKTPFVDIPNVVPFLTGIHGYYPKIRLNVVETYKDRFVVQFSIWSKKTIMKSIRFDYIALLRSKDIGCGTITKTCWKSKSMKCELFTKTSGHRTITVYEPNHNFLQMAGIRGLDFGGSGNIRINYQTPHLLKTWGDTLIWGSLTSNVGIRRNILPPIKNNNKVHIMPVTNKKFASKMKIKYNKLLNAQRKTYQANLYKLLKEYEKLQQSNLNDKKNMDKNFAVLKAEYDKKRRQVGQLNKLITQLQHKKNMNTKFAVLEAEYDKKRKQVTQLNKLITQLQQKNYNYNLISKKTEVNIGNILNKYEKDFTILNILVFELFIYIIQSNFCSKDRNFMFEKLRIIITSIIGSFYNFELDYDKLSEHDKLVIKEPIIRLLL